MPRSLQVALIVLALAPSVIGQTTFTVPGSHPTIQDAINASGNGDTVLVSDGTYVESINFLGKAITVKSVRGADVTTIDANHLARVVSCENNEGADSILEGFTLTNGNAYASSVGYTEYGGGIRCWSASPTIRKCRIIGNAAGTGLGAGDNGGGIACWGSTALIESCVIAGNTARTGGAMHARQPPSPILRNCIIFGNSAVVDDGGINTSGLVTPLIINCTIVGNTAALGGGVGANGGFGGGSTITVVNSIVWGNTPGQIGLNQAGQVLVTYSDIQGGYAGVGNINADPLLTGAPLPWHLTPSSPCRNAGTLSSSLPPTDFEGDPRIVGAGVDIGADEFASLSAACALITRPVLIGQPVRIGVVSPSPNAPIFVFVDVATGSVPLGPWGHAQIALSPAVIPLAAPTTAFGPSLTVPYTNASGSWSVTAGVPNDPQLIGMPFYCESYVLDFSAPNGFFRQSNLLTIVPQ